MSAMAAREARVRSAQVAGVVREMRRLRPDLRVKRCRRVARFTVRWLPQAQAEAGALAHELRVVSEQMTAVVDMVRKSRMVEFLAENRARLAASRPA